MSGTPSRGTLDWAKTELAAAVGIAGGLALLTGYMLTWSRLAAEKLPTESLLTQFPTAFFIRVAVQSLVPAAIVIAICGAGWIQYTRSKLPVDGTPRLFSFIPWHVAWALWWLVISAFSFFVAGRLAGARQTPIHGHTLAAVITALTTAIIGAIAARIPLRAVRDSADEHHEHEQREGGGGWTVTRPILATVIVLSMLTVSAVRVVDARFRKNVLPRAQLIVDNPCASISGGVPVQNKADPTQKTEAPAGRCTYGGYHLGVGGDSYILIQPACDKNTSPRVLIVPREHAQLEILDNVHPDCGLVTPTS